MRKNTLLIALLITVSGLQCLHAQDSLIELDPITVTASVSPQKMSRTGRDLLVIPGEKFASLPVHSVDELLRYIPGIEIQARGPMGAQSDIVMRGGTFQQVLVILDGLRLNDPNTGHFSSYIPIVPGEIDHIEILKGASSAIYGSEAVGGVIHIITKTFASRKGKTASSLQSQVEGGQYDLFSAHVSGYYSDGKTSASAGLLTNNTSGQQQRGTRGSVYANTASLSLSRFLGERWELHLRSAYDSRNFSAQNFYTNFNSDTAQEKVTSIWNQLGLVFHGNKNNVSLNAGYKDLQDQYQFNPAGSPNKNKSRLIQASVTDEWNMNPSTAFVSGMQFINKKIASNDRGDHELSQAAGFVILNKTLGTSLFLSPALRLEWNEGSGWELVPQANISWRLEKLQIRGSVGKTIRDADFTERYNNYQKTFVSSGKIGNPWLEAEHSLSYEAGADYFISKEMKLSGTFFQRYHSRLIDYVPTPYSEMPRQSNLSPTGTYALAKNISKVNTTGAETELLYNRCLRNKHEIWANLGLTWLNSTSSEATPSLYISSHARFLASFNVQYNFNRFGLGINGLYKNRKPQEGTATIAKVSSDYFMMNIKAETFFWQHRMSVFAEADNVFDQQYTDLLGARMPGRWMMGGIKISLSK